MLKPCLLSTGPMMPLIENGCDAAFTVHRLQQAADREALLQQIAPHIRAICTGGHTGVKTDAALIGRFPNLKIVGHSHGYFRGDALRAKVEEINALAPDYLWVALGVPNEQAFVEEYTPLLTNVGVIKTSGGLFNFLSGSRSRAPQWMQKIGLEWAWRTWLEPRRLLWRYLTTNPRAIYLLFSRNRPFNR